MRIPLPRMMRHFRQKQFELAKTDALPRRVLGLWAWVARQPRLYHWLAGLAVPVASWLGRRTGRFVWVPFGAGWTHHRDLAAPEGRTFQSQWRRHMRRSKTLR